MAWSRTLVSAVPRLVGNCRSSKQLSTLQLRDECHFTLWGRPVVQCHLLLVGQTPRLRAVPSRALRILLNYREAAAQPKAAPRQEGRPNNGCPSKSAVSRYRES